MEPQAEFFATTHYPHRWSSGPRTRTFDDEYKPFESLDAARLWAEEHFVGGHSESRCVTAYGVQYKVKER